MRTIEERWRWVAWAWKTSIKQARRRTRVTLYDGCMTFMHIQIHVKPESVEAFRQATTAKAPAQHRETAHYKTWLNTVAEMMAEPRTRVKCANIFPGDEGW